jgi:hypothetical protein
MTKIMKTLWDESAELSEETLSTRSVLSDDYTSGDHDKLSETMAKEEEIEEVIDETLKIEKPKK